MNGGEIRTLARRMAAGMARLLVDGKDTITPADLSGQSDMTIEAVAELRPDAASTCAAVLAARTPPGSSAVLSPCGRFRFRLGRTWGDASGPRVAFVMLNPSTADARHDDATIRRCVAFARGWGFDGLDVVNLYAQRATDPADLYRELLIGIDNDDHVRAVATSADLVVAAWGAFADAPVERARSVAHRARRVAAMLDASGVRLFALATTAEGWPAHPLYQPAAAAPKAWKPPRPDSFRPIQPPTDDEVQGGHIHANNDAGTPRGSRLAARVAWPESGAIQRRIWLAARGLRGILAGSRLDLHDGARRRLAELADLAASVQPDADGFTALNATDAT